MEYSTRSPQHEQFDRIEQPERTDYPTWGKKKWNGNATLIEGVWVDDFDTPRPTPAQLRKFRHDYLLRTRVETYTLVEGEQMAPMGRGGRLIRVSAKNAPRESSYIQDKHGHITQFVPSIHIRSLDPGEWWVCSVTGTLPMTFQRIVDESGQQP